MHDMLQRANELAIKAATGTLQDSDRMMIDAEIQQLKAEIDSTARNTTFNEISIFPENGHSPLATSYMESKAGDPLCGQCEESVWRDTEPAGAYHI